MKHLLALDQGTTSSRAIIFTTEGTIVASAQTELTQHFPQPGWVEHDPLEIWSTQRDVALTALQQSGLTAHDIAAIGITNQRETTILWDRRTGKPVHHAIVWQDRRTASFCQQLKEDGHEPFIQNKTGLVIDAYFSASKIRWLLDNIPGLKEKARDGHIAFGTVDSWLLWNLTEGRVHATDVSNASRTMLMDLPTCQWDNELLDLFQIPDSILPAIRHSSGLLGETSFLGANIPITGLAGDQQAALFGQQCTSPGLVKNTYGTGCFLLMPTGSKPVFAPGHLLTTVAWRMQGATHYALEGSIFVAGALIQWLRDGLGLIKQATEIESLAASVPDSGGVTLVPAFTGLGAPHWDPHARGLLIGLTRGTSKAHIARAALEAICFQVVEIVRLLENVTRTPLKELRVDGGAATNNLLLQMQADLLGTPVVRRTVTESTALGAAALAGQAIGLAEDPDFLNKALTPDRLFAPTTNDQDRNNYLTHWIKAVERCKGWSEPQ